MKYYPGTFYVYNFSHTHTHRASPMPCTVYASKCAPNRTVASNFVKPSPGILSACSHQLLWSPWVLLLSSSVQCCFTSTETIRTVRGREPRTSTSAFTQLLISNSFAVSTQADFEGEEEEKGGGGGFEACQTDTLLLFYINNPTKAA